MKHDLNIPIETIRSIIAISEKGSLSKAAEKLNFSQPALSSQVKRLQATLGRELFHRTANGSSLTEIGKLFVEQARRIIDAHDQILGLGGRLSREEPIHLGISNLYVPELFKFLSAETLSNVIIQGGNSTEIAKGLVEGFIDVGYFFSTPILAEQTSNMIVNEVEEHFVWARSKNFVLSPGAPIPILSYPDSAMDLLMVRALSNKGLSYRVAFSSADNLARMAAAEAGIGMIALPTRLNPFPLVQAREYYLPPLAPLKALLCVREGFHNGSSLLKLLSTHLFNNGSSIYPSSMDKFQPSHTDRSDDRI